MILSVNTCTYCYDNSAQGNNFAQGNTLKQLWWNETANTSTRTKNCTSPSKVVS